jgi:DNA-binding transcriptional ArsR family regulator
VKARAKDTDVKRMTRVFKALSNPNRLQIFLNLLRESQVDLAAGKAHTCFLSTLLENLRVGAPTISHHVKELENAELIQTQRDGKQLLCSVNPEMVRELQGLFDELAPSA